jgi:hypothetical protein
MVEDFFADRSMRVGRVKLAQPLYDLQAEFYRIAGVPIGPYEQDQKLLETIATQLRRLSPTSLIDDFERRMKSLDGCDVVLNDDLRDPHVDYPRLLDLGFRFVRIRCDESVRADRLRRRGDRSVVLSSKSTVGIDLIHPDVEVDNSTAGFDVLREKLFDAVARVS